MDKFDLLMKRELKEHWEGNELGEVIRCYELVKSFALTLSCSYLLGMEAERSAKLSGKFDDIVNGIQSIHVEFPGTVFYRAKRAAEEVRREIEVLIEEKRGVATSEDLLSMLMAGDQSGKIMLPSTVANIIMGVMAASYGSVVTAITYMLKFVGERTQVYDKIYSGDLLLKKNRKILAALSFSFNAFIIS